MTLKSIFAVSAFALTLMALVPVPGYAWDGRGGNHWGHGYGGDDHNGWHDRGRGRDHDRGGYGHEYGGPVYFNNYRPSQPRVVTRYVPYDRPVIRYHRRPPVAYYRDVVYYRNVPRYGIGQRIDYRYDVPRNVLVQLDPAPQGYYYSMGPQNVYLVSHYDNAIAQIIDVLLR